MTKETEELSPATCELLSKARTRSDELDDDASMDRTLEHIAKSYLIANRYGEELTEEHTDLASEAAQERKRLRQWIRDDRKI